MASLDEMKKRGIEYLMSQRSKPKQPNEFSVRELAPLLKISESSVYEHMRLLVAKNIWGTRVAFDESVHKNVKVWWLIEKDEG